MRRSPCARALGVLVVLSLPLACGRGDASENPSPTKALKAPPVGQILQVIDPLMTVNNQPIAADEEFAADSSLRTDESGAARFKLGERFDDCQMRRGSEIRVLPSESDLTLRFDKGMTICKTPAGKDKHMKLGTEHARLDVRDPIFTVEVQTNQTVVRVAEGFVQVRGLTDDGPRLLVGPGQQVVVAEGGTPGPPEPFDLQRLEPAEQEAIGRMQAAMPQPAFGLPDPSGSPVLTRIGQAKTLRLGIDPGADDRSTRFIQGVFNFIGEHWGVNIETASMSTKAAPAALASGGVDIFIPPGLLGGGRSIPFFNDELQRAWLLHVDGGDSRFESALRDFLFSTLNVGEYGRRYTDAFSRVPDYEILRPVVFANEPPTSEPAATSTTTASESTTSTSRPAPASRPASTTTSTANSTPAPAPNATSTTQASQSSSPSPTTTAPPSSSTTSTTSSSGIQVGKDCQYRIGDSEGKC